MVWKCCVPQCKSRWQIPVHRFPVDSSRVKHWLTIICKTELIGAPKETLAKLRICTEHFSEDMILPYGPKRRLSDNAIPNLNLPSLNITQYVDVNVNDNFDEYVNVAKNVPVNFDIVPSPINMGEKDTTNMELERRSLRLLKKKLRIQWKLLHNKKRIIYNQRQEINRLRHGNNWDDITRDMSNMQKTFIQILTTNLRCVPQGHRYKEK